MSEKFGKPTPSNKQRLEENVASIATLSPVSRSMHVYLSRQSDHPNFGSEQDARIELPVTFGKFELLEHIGTGGMGTVYRARQSDVGRIVALKMIRGLDPGSDNAMCPAEIVDLFRREAEFASSFQHPNIVTIYEFLLIDGIACISMQLIDGVSAREKSYRNQMTINESVDCMLAVSDAVEQLHQAGVVHRDIKPANILCSSSNAYFLSDFGIAVSDLEQKSEIGRRLVGTVPFAAPEQLADSSKADARSDVYSLGATLYQLLTGKAPFRAASIEEAAKLVEAQIPISPRTLNDSVDADLDAIVMKCLEKTPANRYASVVELVDDLGNWKAGRPTRVRPVGSVTRLLRWARREPIVSGLSAVCLLLLSASTAIATVGWLNQVSTTQQLSAANDKKQQAMEASNQMLLDMLGLYNSGDADLATNDKSIKRASETFRGWLASLEANELIGDDPMVGAQVKLSLSDRFREIGEVELSRKLRDETEFQFREAAATDAKWNHELAQIMFQHAQDSMAASQQEEALKQLELADELIKKSDETSSAKMLQMGILSMRSLVLGKLDRIGDAIAVAEKLVVDDIQWEHISASELNNFGLNRQRLLNLLLQRGKLKDPLKEYSAQQEYWQKAISLHPGSNDLRARFAESLLTYGMLLGSTEPEKSRSIRRQCYEQYWTVFRLQPGRDSILFSLFSAANNLIYGELNLGGSLENAKVVYTETVELARPIEATRGQRHRFRSNYALLLGSGADIAYRESNFALGEQRLLEAKKLFELILKDNPENPRVTGRLATNMLSMAQLKLAEGTDLAAAEKHALHAAKSISSLESRFYDGRRFQIAQTMFDIAKKYDAESDVEKFLSLLVAAVEVTQFERLEYLEPLLDRLADLKRFDECTALLNALTSDKPQLQQFVRKKRAELALLARP
jgi:serine/threonine protein kinase